jgi:predicted phosphoribosyltransferase
MKGDAMLKSIGSQPFSDRRDAGRELAKHLRTYENGDDVVVLALPRGGVPVAFEVARALHAPLDVFVVRKIGMPGHREFGVGAIASGGVKVIDDEVLRLYGVPHAAVEAIAREEGEELKRREQLYREGRPPQELQGRTVILVDDGLATGSSMKAAVQAVRLRQPARVVVAVPVGATETCRLMTELADESVCARMPEPFSAVGLWYRDFSQTSDEEVLELLEESQMTGTRRT